MKKRNRRGIHSAAVFLYRSERSVGRQDAKVAKLCLDEELVAQFNIGSLVVYLYVVGLVVLAPWRRKGPEFSLDWEEAWC